MAIERGRRDAERPSAHSAKQVAGASAHEQILSVYSAIGNAAFSRLIAPEPRAILRVAKGGKKSRERPSRTRETPAGVPLLREGSRGPSVTALQAELVVCGFEIAVDGIFGPQTDGAVRAFQAEEGLEADGIVGPLTRAALLRRALPRG